MRTSELIAILCVSIFVISVHSSRLYEKTCGILYDENNFKGKSLELKDGSSFSNLGETYITRDTVWNVTKSFQVDKGCLLTVCNESYFDGECKEFGANVTETPLQFDPLLSINCTCAKECKCSDVQMSRSSCARGYINKGCNTCNAFYTEFKGNLSWISDSFTNSIVSIIVKKGCSLTIFKEEDFEGPPFIDVPLSADNISTLLHTELGNLPGNRKHPGLIAALNSIKGKRSPRNAYILVLGVTGAGKSSTINMLFDNEMATNISHESSKSWGIEELRIPIQVNHLGIQNSELRIIDTPGLGDTRGLEQDAQFLATLEEYLKGHEELSKRIPNIVLVFAKFHNNRFSGAVCSFVKMLRAIDSFRDRITDKNFSNVIFVLTHYMSETKSARRLPGVILLSFKNVIEQYSLFPKPTSIVVAENKAAENELPMMNGNYRLPNGDFFPRNIFEKIKFVTLNGNDPIGDGVIRSAYSQSHDFNVTRKFIGLLDSEQRNVAKYLRLLSDFTYYPENTEIFRMLATVHKLMDLNLVQKYPDALPYLQRYFHRRNIFSTSDLPKTRLKIVRFMRDIKHNEATSYLMEHAFGLKAPDFRIKITTGRGYDITRDKALIASPFPIEYLRNSEIGYRISNIIDGKTNTQPISKTFFRAFANKEDYFKNRLNYFNVQDQISSEFFSGEIKPGSNALNSSLNPNGTIRLTALKEFRTFELVLNHKPKLTHNFITFVKTLTKFNSSDPESVKIWKTFFDESGTHVVKSTYGGGSIEVNTVSNLLNLPETTLALSKIMAFIEDPTIGKPNNINFDSIQVSLDFQGGYTRYHKTDLLKLSLDDAFEVLENWKESLLTSPVILESEIQLVPMSEVASALGHHYAFLIQSAVQEMFNPLSKSHARNPDQSEREGRGESGSVSTFDILKFARDFKEIVGSNPRSDPGMTNVFKIVQQSRIQGWTLLENERLPLIHWIRGQYQLRALRENMDSQLFSDIMTEADKRLSDEMETLEKFRVAEKQRNYDAQLIILRAAAANLEGQFKIGFFKTKSRAGR